MPVKGRNLSEMLAAGDDDTQPPISLAGSALPWKLEATLDLTTTFKNHAAQLTLWLRQLHQRIQLQIRNPKP